MGRGAVLAMAGAASLALGAAPAKHAARPTSSAAAPTAPPAAAGPVTGPIAEYWVSAATASGMGAGMMGGGRPSMSQIMAMASGRGPSSQRTLELQLGSTQRPSGPPAADHFVPQGLGVGPSLPLATPQVVQARAERAEPGEPESYQRPKGKILIYWGCGEHVGPGQPVVFDFSTIGTGAPMPDLGGAIKVSTERPPSQGRSATYGHWPNEKKQVQVPQGGSLVGAHDLRGDYSPEMRFDVGPELDFMPGLGLQSAGATPGGGKRLTWQSAPTATGYHLMLIGAQSEGEGGGGRGGRGGRGGDDPTAAGATMVFWSSSAVKPGFFGGGLADYLPPGEVARLVRERAVLPPGTTECVVPSEVAQASPMGLVSEIGYGPEQVWTDPPRPRSGPWNLSWRAKLRVKSTATLILGMPSMNGDDDEDGPRRPRRAGSGYGQPASPAYPPPSAPTAGDAAKDLLRRFRPF